MIEDAILDMIEDRAMDVMAVRYHVMRELDASAEEVESAIMNLEDQGKVRGFYKDGTAKIEAVPKEAGE